MDLEPLHKEETIVYSILETNTTFESESWNRIEVVKVNIYDVNQTRERKGGKIQTTKRVTV